MIGLQEEVQAQPLDVSGGCSRLDPFESADGIKNTTLEPGERVGASYAIAGVDGNLQGNCPEPAEYQMAHDLGEYGTWGFDVRLD